MKDNRARAFSPLLFFAISIIGLVLVPFLIMEPNLHSFQFADQRSLVGTTFCAVCVCGVVAVFYPAKCSRMFQHTLDPHLPVKSAQNGLRMEGHHPSCQNFLANRIKILGRVFCAACSGLLVGAAISLVAAGAYFFGGLNAGLGSVWLILFGEICMFLGLVQIKAAEFVKATLNALFVVGSFVTLAAVDAIEKSLLVDFYVLGLILFFLWFRISLSEWNNRRICRECRVCFQ